MTRSRRSLLALAAILLPALLDVTGSATASPTITEFPLATADQAPTQIVAGPSGALWFTESSADDLGSISTSGVFSQFAGLSGPAQGIAVGPDGNLWVTEPGANRIARVTPAGVVTEFALASNADPTSITAGPDGNLWFTEKGANAIGRITPSASANAPLGTITLFTAGLSQSGVPTAITAGPDGTLWFTESGLPAGAIGTITPAGAITLYNHGLPLLSAPTSITTGRDGNLWFTVDGLTGGAIGQITPSGAITLFTAGLSANSVPAGITAGPDGSLWFTDFTSPGMIGQITTAGAISEFPTPTAAAKPLGIATGADGNVWFTESGHPGAIGRLTVSSTPTPAPTQTAPTAATAAATAIAQTTVALNGTVDPDGVATSYQFQWGPTTAYGNDAPAVLGVVGSQSSPQVVSQLLSGLAAGTTYHYRLIATSCAGCQAGTTDGADMTFTTAAAPAPVSGGGSTPVVTPPAPPQVSRTATAGVVAGTVWVQVPGSKTPRALTGTGDIPIGSLVDASQGTLRITTALNAAGRVQTATVWGGSFVLGQPARQKGRTTFTLPAPVGCQAHAHAVHALDLRAHAGARKPPPSLWATDNHGQYSTRGNNSVATVRGTDWKTVNSCAGTLTFVKRGVVSVEDLRRHRTVVLTAGHSYLARP